MQSIYMYHKLVSFIFLINYFNIVTPTTVIIYQHIGFCKILSQENKGFQHTFDEKLQLYESVSRNIVNKDLE